MHDFFQSLRKRVKPPASLEKRGVCAASAAAGEILTPSRAAIETSRGAPAYLPLEEFRRQKLSPAGSPARTFRSSGTTQAARSRVQFSAEGLAAYQWASLTTFFAVLADATGRSPDELTGISLIPPPAEWPDSSLAQMIGWIADVVPVTYTEVGDLQRTIQSAGSRPVWVFGTAFHLIQALDAGDTGALPEGSRMIETGGTKGRSRELAREEFYKELSRGFCVREAAIMSEYGMCELAAQAYDWLPAGTERPLGKRRFRFPRWVRTGVVRGPETVHGAGEGALLVEDPLRLDVPKPIRTEDHVTLDEAGMVLHGRVAKAPLKGCSLNAEAAVIPPAEATGKKATSSPPAPASSVDFCEATVKRRLERLAPALERFLTGKRAIDALASELGSGPAAAAAIEDLAKGRPSAADGWCAAARAALGQEPGPRQWLWIPPQAHSLAAFYPLAMAYLLGHEVFFRMPSTEEKPLAFLEATMEFYETLDAGFCRTLPASFRVGRDPIPEGCEALLAFGSNETVARLRELTSLPVQGFGNRIAVSLFEGPEASVAANPLMRDALSLGQRGCMTTRLAVCLEDGDDQSIPFDATEFHIAARSFWQAEHGLDVHLGWEREQWRYRSLGFHAATPHTNGALVPVQSSRLSPDAAASENFWAQVLSSFSFVLPVVRIPKENAPATLSAIFKQLARLGAPVGTVTLPDATKSRIKPALARALANPRHSPLRWAPLGAGNAPPWNGLHEGRPLFGNLSL